MTVFMSSGNANLMFSARTNLKAAIFEIFLFHENVKIISN